MKKINTKQNTEQCDLCHCELCRGAQYCFTHKSVVCPVKSKKTTQETKDLGNDYMDAPYNQGKDEIIVNRAGDILRDTTKLSDSNIGNTQAKHRQVAHEDNQLRDFTVEDRIFSKEPFKGDSFRRGYQMGVAETRKRVLGEVLGKLKDLPVGSFDSTPYLKEFIAKLKEEIK